MDIWKDGISLSDKLFDIADSAENKRLFKFAEQFRSACMSITNNIAEGSGSYSDKDFANFLNTARRSIFECANILYIFERRKIINQEIRSEIFPDLTALSRKITNFRRALLNPTN
ncbi:MAG: four helix bundle protein [Bacteroidales bacterium]|nr:four helix bundle protein [Bacteroidales bacterium]